MTTEGDLIFEQKMYKRRGNEHNLLHALCTEERVKNASSMCRALQRPASCLYEDIVYRMINLCGEYDSEGR